MPGGRGFCRSLLKKKKQKKNKQTKKKNLQGGVAPMEAFLQFLKDRWWTGLGH